MNTSSKESNPALPASPQSAEFPTALGEVDLRFLEDQEEIVTRAVETGLAAARALHQIKTYRDGLLWRNEYRTFEQYCQNRWGFQKSHAYRLLETGAFLNRIEVDGLSPVGENSGLRESHLRPVVTKVPEHLQAECWQLIADGLSAGETLTASKVDSGVAEFLREKGVQPKTPKHTGQKARKSALNSVRKLKAQLVPLQLGVRFHSLMDELERLLEECGGGADVCIHAEQSTDTVLDLAMAGESDAGELSLCCEPPSPSLIEARPAAGLNWFRKPDGEAVIGYVQESATPPHLTILNPDDGSEIPLPGDYVWIGTTAPSRNSATLIDVEVMSAPQAYAADLRELASHVEVSEQLAAVGFMTPLLDLAVDHWEIAQPGSPESRPA